MEDHSNYQGKLIVFEGIHGAGKTTQITRLRKRLGNLGYKILISKAHKGDIINKTIYKLVTLPSSPGFNDQIVRLFLICAARASRVKNEIIPALQEGKIVICDRYFPSTLAYQSYVGGLNYNFVAKASNLSCQGIKADLSLVLDLAATQAKQRIKRNTKNAKKNSLDNLPLKYHQKGRKGFLKFASKFDWKIVDASQSKDAVETTIWKEVKRILNDDCG